MSLVMLPEAEAEYAKLNDNEKQTVGQIMLDARRRYIASGFKVDLPYFFGSIHRNMFADNEEFLKFIDIKNSKTFTMNAIWLVSRFILAAREGTTVSDMKGEQ